MLRVAVIGSGPAGVYATAALVRQAGSHCGGVLVDVFERLPCPFGLVRYGVAPDHPKIKSISATLRQVFDDPAVRFFGNVGLGSDITYTDLRRHYDAFILASGAPVDRRLGIPGEDLPGSFSATDFVAWYCGHPDAPIDRFTLAAHSVAVVGVGNVALDVTRILARSAADLRATDVPDQVLDVLGRSQVRDIYLIGRRGPAQAKFTTKELRELGDVADADLLVDPRELDLDDASRRLVDTEPTVRRNLEVFAAWAKRPPAGRPRRVHLCFLLRPLEVLGDARVTGLRLERTRLNRDGTATGTGQVSTLDVQMVLRSVGYRGIPLDGLPFDAAAGVVPNAAGRVLRDGAVAPGEYVAGWIKRGPTGVIGTNKHDANETVAALLHDAPALPPAPVRDPGAIPRLLAARGVQVVSWQGWCAIESAEADLGLLLGRDRVKIVDRAALLAAAARATRAGGQG